MRKTSLDMVYELAKVDERVLFIGSDLGPGVLKEFKENIPDRFIMEGISEQHIIGMAAGLAFDGFIPYVNTIATFLTRRCFEQIAIDLCLHDLPVKLIANGGGLVYAPLGPTHQAIEDIGILRTVPNMTIVSPCDADEMKRLMLQSLNWPHPLYIRLAKGGDKIISEENNGFEIGKGIPLKNGDDVLFITTGVTAQIAIDVTELLKEKNIHCGIFHMHTIKPFDFRGLIECSKQYKLIVSIEEHVLIGGLGSAIIECLSDNKIYKEVIRYGIPDVFATEYGSQSNLIDSFGMNIENIASGVITQLNKS